MLRLKLQRLMADWELHKQRLPIQKRVRIRQGIILCHRVAIKQ